MGLTGESTGLRMVQSPKSIQRQPGEKVVALAGNPNVGKSTVFNFLTGLNQHTGNWPGKTVSNAQGKCERDGRTFVLVDLPGTYSLMAHSAEEEVARDFLCFGEPDAAIVVCDATCLERNLNLVLQTQEITSRVVVCVNLIDEAEKKHIRVDVQRLSKLLGAPVVATGARSGKGLEELMRQVERVMEQEPPAASTVQYPREIEQALALLTPAVERAVHGRLPARWLSLKLLEGDESLLRSVDTYLGASLLQTGAVAGAKKEAERTLRAAGIGAERFVDLVTAACVRKAEGISREAVRFERGDPMRRDRMLDKIFTGRVTGLLTMLLLLALVFWLTITGANFLSDWLSQGAGIVEGWLTDFFRWAHAPDWLYGALVQGVYRVMAWVVSVMLPPMAIFFPLFTFLEDLGYLPRVAFNLDRFFKKSGACGKQALTMCMGFGCNAAGVVGCRIIDSRRERLIAMLTNNFVPCNGRFPTLIAILSMFFITASAGVLGSVASALALTGVILLGVVMTLLVSRLLSRTILSGVPSSFTLELPPYRRPQVGKLLVRSVLDRTLFVLGRAVAVAAPAGLVIWLLSNITVGDMSLFAHCTAFLDPFARLFGMDGVILMAFILGFPANEIVLPIIMMGYMASGTLTSYESLDALRVLLVDNGWTWVTAACVMLFSLMHWPCSTTCLTIRKESGSVKWMLLSMVIPTAVGLSLCFLLRSVSLLL